MPLRAIIFDVDGVLIVHPDPAGWSVHLERDLGLPVALLQKAFFKPHWPDIMLGRAPLRERLAPVLAQIAPGLTCGQLIDYWFAADAHLNRPLLEEAARLRASGVPLHLATVQEHERARHLWETLGFRDRFDHLHYSADLGAAKPHPDFYARVEARTGLAGQDIVFIDDKPENVAAARLRGWGAACWTGERRLADLLAAAGYPPVSD